MVAYGMIKNAIHHLVRSMADGNVTCVGILPGILDTPDNRKWIKNVDVNTFTPLNFLAKYLQFYFLIHQYFRNSICVSENKIVPPKR